MIHFMGSSLRGKLAAAKKVDSLNGCLLASPLRDPFDQGVGVPLRLFGEIVGIIMRSPSEHALQGKSAHKFQIIQTRDVRCLCVSLRKRCSKYGGHECSHHKVSRAKPPLLYKEVIKNSKAALVQLALVLPNPLKWDGNGDASGFT